MSCFVPGVDRLDKDLTIGQMQGKSSRICACGSFSEGGEMGSHMKMDVPR